MYYPQSYQIGIKSVHFYILFRYKHTLFRTSDNDKIQSNLVKRTQITRFGSSSPSKVCLDKVIVGDVFFGLLLQKWLIVFSAYILPL